MDLAGRLEPAFRKHGIELEERHAFVRHVDSMHGGYSEVLALYSDMPELFPILAEARTDIANILIDELFRLARSEEVYQGDLVDLGLVNRGMSVSRSLIGLLAAVAKAGAEVPRPLTVKWIRDNTDCFDNVNRACDGDWNYVAELMPSDIPLVPEKKYVKAFDEDQMREKILSLKSVVEKIGGAAVAQYLFSLNLIGDRTVNTLSDLITAHLGDCSSNPLEFKDVPILPIDAMRNPDVYKVVFIHLRDEIYRRLTEDAIVGDAAEQEFLLGITADYAKHFFNLAEPLHKKMYDELMEYWKTVIHLQSGERMEDRVDDETGTSCPFPSLLQKVSIFEMSREKRQLNASLMGRGKSACPFLTFEYLKEKGEIADGQKLAIVCPPSMVPDFQKRVTKYYKDDRAPSVGVITKDLKNNSDDLKTQLAAEIIIISDTMIDQRRSRKDADGEEINILDALVDLDIAYIAADEAHRARNEHSTKARDLQKLCNGRDGELGYLQLMTASPLPNRVYDVLTYLKLLYPAEYAHIDRIGNIDPLRLHNTLLKCLINLDPVDKWREEVETIRYDLGQHERAAYEFIRGIRDLSISEKLLMLRQFMLNPKLKTDGVDEQALFECVTSALEGDFEETDVVYIAHTELVDGFTRSKTEGVDTWVDKLRAHFGDKVEVLVIDGNTSMVKDPETGESERDQIINSNPPAGKKRIVLVNGSTIQLGISLVHIKAFYRIDSDYNDSGDQQLFRRYNRAGSDDTKAKEFIGNGTIVEVIQKLAILKAKLTTLALYGGNLTRKHMQQLEKLDMEFDDLDVDYSDEAAVFASLLLEDLLVGGAYSDRFQRNFHMKGEDSLREILESRGEIIADRMQEDYPYSYHGNNARFTASLIAQLEENGLVPTGARNYLDVYSGMGTMGSLLATSKADADRTVHSIDPNPHIVKYGKRLSNDIGVLELAANMRQGGLSDLTTFEDGSLDVCHINLAFNILFNSQKRDAIRCLSSKLKTGGVVAFTFPAYVGKDNERKSFLKALEHYGFEIQEDYTGAGSAGKGDQYFENFIVVAKKVSELPVKDLHANDFQLSIYDRSTGKTDRRKREGLYAFHNEFEINGWGGKSTVVSMELEDTKDHALMNLVEGLRAFLEASLRQGKSLSEIKIPASFAELNAQVRLVGGTHYLGIPGTGDKFTTLTLNVTPEA